MLHFIEKQYWAYGYDLKQSYLCEASSNKLIQFFSEVAALEWTTQTRPQVRILYAGAYIRPLKDIYRSTVEALGGGQRSNMLVKSRYARNNFYVITQSRYFKWITCDQTSPWTNNT